MIPPPFPAHRPSAIRASALWGLLALAVGAGAATACGPTTSGGSSSGTPVTTGGNPGDEGPTARELFAEIEPDLVAACSKCHKAGGSADAPFIAGETIDERYTSITAWPGVVVSDPNLSILMTHPGEASHGGGEAPDLPAKTKPKVLEWLEAEANELPDADTDIGPSVKPFKPLVGGAFNTIYLGELGPEFEFMSISFNAEALGGTSAEPTMLRLANLTVHTVTGKPLHIVHPLFTVYDPSAKPDPDPIDSFSNVDQTFTIDGDPTLGTGELVLTNWRKGAYLGVAFQIVEVYGGTPGEGGTCKDIASFKAQVVPAMQTCMAECHGGKNPQAKGTMDLSELNLATPDAACIQVRARITPGDPDTSQIIRMTDPAGVEVHMYKFLGDLNKYNDFKTKVSPWIKAEQ
ncbi:hypothetical protein [Polyangium aurulentum]|uniref:hypothetical protein n=1 Tax=Polyangium aurulentum TaxID=2567896 RepID=UPI00146BBFE2|nr:hypothetical protein [Polyangium aurulentum]UQA57987.1 hypothetical protein E8A73_043080 [Polyangium aurulentum]